MTRTKPCIRRSAVSRDPIFHSRTNCFFAYPPNKPFPVLLRDYRSRVPTDCMRPWVEALPSITSTCKRLRSRTRIKAGTECCFPIPRWATLVCPRSVCTHKRRNSLFMACCRSKRSGRGHSGASTRDRAAAERFFVTDQIIRKRCRIP